MLLVLYSVISLPNLGSEASYVYIETSNSALESPENTTKNILVDSTRPDPKSTTVLAANEGQRKLQDFSCDGNCNNNGVCIYGVCDCSDLYYGSSCREYPEHLNWDQSKEIKIPSNSWSYYLLEFGEIELEADVTKNPIICYIQSLNSYYPTLPNQKHSTSIIRFQAKDSTQFAKIQGNYAEKSTLVVGFQCESKHEACDLSFIFNDLSKENERPYLVWIILGIVVTVVRGM
jgi:hypothetical protein